MNYLTGNHLKALLQEQNFSFRDASRMLDISAEKMNELLKSERIERTRFIEINKRLNLGINIDPFPPDYIDPRDRELEHLRGFKKEVQSFLNDLKNIINPVNFPKEGIMKLTEVLRNFDKKTDQI